MENTCCCSYLLQRDKPIVFHVYGCPETDEYKEYRALKWYQKLFKHDPYDLYLEHFKPN